MESNVQNVVILNKFTCKGTLRQVFICLRPTPLLGLLGVSSNFVGSESGHIQSIKRLQNMVFNRIRFFTVKGEGRGTKEDRQ